MSLLSGNALVTGAGMCGPRKVLVQATNQTVITGSGIGRQLSIAFVRAGITGITLADLSADGLAETVRLIQADFPSVNVLPLVVDVTDERSVEDMVSKAVETFGSLECGKLHQRCALKCAFR